MRDDRWPVVSHYTMRERVGHTALKQRHRALTAERDAALAETAKLREAVLWTTAMFKYPDEGALEAFERVGDLFFRETGYLRPGKSCLIHDHDVRQAAFDEWFAGKLAAARALVEPSR